MRFPEFQLHIFLLDLPMGRRSLRRGLCLNGRGGPWADGDGLQLREMHFPNPARRHHQGECGNKLRPGCGRDETFAGNR